MTHDRHSIDRTIHSLRGLLCIACLCLAIGAAHAEGPKEPQTPEHRVENRKSAATLSAATVNRYLEIKQKGMI